MPRYTVYLGGNFAQLPAGETTVSIGVSMAGYRREGEPPPNWVREDTRVMEVEAADDNEMWERLETIATAADVSNLRRWGMHKPVKGAEDDR
jgi:hypothetical protein